MSHYDTITLLIAFGIVIGTIFGGTIGWIAGRRYERLANPPTENIRPLFPFPIPPRYEEWSNNPINWTELPLQQEEFASGTATYSPDESVDNT